MILYRNYSGEKTNMTRTQLIKEKIKERFPHPQAESLSEIVDLYEDVVKVSDFTELKEIVRDLASAQKETEIKMKELAEVQKRTEKKIEELTEAQKRTEQRLEELAEAQKKTEKKVEELAEAQKRTEQRLDSLTLKVEELAEETKKLAIGLNRTREDLGGLARSFGYAFENEAYRMLPSFLKKKYGIDIKEKVVRAEIAGKEVNFFGRAMKDGKEVFLVGEARARLDDTKKRTDVIKDLEDKVRAVKDEYGDVEVVRLLVTHFATKGFLKKIKDRDIIVVESYQW